MIYGSLSSNRLPRATWHEGPAQPQPSISHCAALSIINEEHTGHALGAMLIDPMSIANADRFNEHCHKTLAHMLLVDPGGSWLGHQGHQNLSKEIYLANLRLFSLLSQSIGWKCKHTSLSVLKANVGVGFQHAERRMFAFPAHALGQQRE